MENVEIEKKYLVKEMPKDLSNYEHKSLEQAYLCTDPVVRIRKEDDRYELTYKGKGKMVRSEYNLPLNEEAYHHLKQKSDGNVIHKTRYVIPLENSLKAELDVFSAPFFPLILLEVEFPDEQTAESFTPPSWFGEEVTKDSRYHNSNMSKATQFPYL